MIYENIREFVVASRARYFETTKETQQNDIVGWFDDINVSINTEDGRRAEFTIVWAKKGLPSMTFIRLVFYDDAWWLLADPDFAFLFEALAGVGLHNEYRQLGPDEVAEILKTIGFTDTSGQYK